MCVTMARGFPHMPLAVDARDRREMFTRANRCTGTGCTWQLHDLRQWGSFLAGHPEIQPGPVHCSLAQLQMPRLPITSIPA
jgi:hypothetical protein